MKQKDANDWTPINTDPHPDTTFTASNLKELEEYQFRVIAVNDIGKSSPSKPSSLIKIEEQPDKPCMDLSGIRDITVKAGEDFSIHVPYTAFPKPTSTWYWDDQEIVIDADHRIHQQLEEDYCAIIFTNAKRSDTGQYKLKLTNPCGFDTMKVNVKVLDRPAPPENLIADEFGGESLTLSWRPPKDNGGSEVTNYVVEKREAKTATWHRISSYCTQPSIRVRNLTVNKEYDFRVMAENHYGTSDPCTTPNPIRARHPFSKLILLH